MKPLVKWPGGKARLLPQLDELLPATMDFYIEPFLGGGALLMHLLEEGRVGTAVGADSNGALVGLYEAVKEDPFTLIRRLSLLEEGYLSLSSNPAHLDRMLVYYEQRRVFNAGRRTPERFLFLNKTCFNGLWRENARGEFNAPHGKYKKPKICDAALLRACSAAFDRCHFFQADALAVIDHFTEKGAVMYCDPPYLPINTKSFVSYGPSKFGVAEHRLLAKLGVEAAARGAYVIISSSDTPEARRIYRGYERQEVFMRRNINRVGEGRGEVGELIFVKGRKP